MTKTVSSSSSRPLTWRLSALSLLTGALLAGCSSTGGLPEPGRLPTAGDATRASAERFRQDAGEAGVKRIRVPGSSMDGISTRQRVSNSIRSRPSKVTFPNQSATVQDLIDALSGQDVQFAFRWETSAAESILTRRLPFVRFNGDMGGLLDALETGLGIVAWQEGDIVFLSDADRYAVTLPQNDEVLKSVEASLTSLGATSVVTSLDAGKIIYTSTPSLNNEVIRPFLKRTTRNLSTINLQVAIVSLALNDKSSSGFDWAKFSASIDGRQSTIDAADGKDVAGGTGSDAASAAIRRKGTMIDLTQNGLSLGVTNIGAVFGAKAVQSVSGAIGYLSTFGNTNVTQHVDLRTLSGKAVKIRSGQEIPYVKDVGAVSTEGTVTGSTETSVVSTGLTVEMTPRFDADSEVVTVEVSLQLSSIIEFVDLKAGNQVGTISQPSTQEQELTDIVQMRAGQTVIIGGIQYDQEQYNGNEPTFMRNTMRQNSRSFGKRDQDVARNSIFVIMRPTVDIYETDAQAVRNVGVTK